MSIAVPGKTVGIVGKPFPTGNVQTWGRRSRHHLFWKTPPSSSSPSRYTRLQEGSGCICFSLLLYELKRRKKKKDRKQTKSLHSLFVFSWFQTVPSTLFSAGAHFGCTHGLGEAVGLSPLQPTAPHFFRDTLEFIVF